MPFDANGNFSLVPGTIVADGMNVLPSQHNPPFQDVANGLSQAVVRDGRAPMTGPLNMNGNKITGVAAGDAPDDVVTNAAIADLGVAIGDGKWSLRDLSPNWLRRDGKLYLINDYPDLAALLPPLSDSVTWTNRSSGVTSVIVSVFPKPEGFLAVASASGGTTILSSADGQIWSSVSTITGFRAECATYQNGVFVLGGDEGDIVTSTDALIWSSPLAVFTGSSDFVADLAFGAGVWVAVGGGGKIATSDDLASWTPRTSGVSAYLYRIRYLNSTFVIVGYGGTILTSGDGETWAARVSGTTANLQGVAFGDGKYIAVGSGGEGRSSTNLISWSSVAVGTSASLHDIVYSSAGFMAVGASGVARYSTNGTTWGGSPSGTGATLRSLTFDPEQPQRYIAVGFAGTIIDGIRTLPTQFRVPNDGPNEWVRAL